jgi:oligogalacturonide lyase
MPKGTFHPQESISYLDARTGASVRQVTAHPSIHHHPFFYIPAYDDAMRWLVFVSHRTGSAQIFVEERASGRLLQVTDRTDLNEWSLHPSYDGRFIYFTAGSGAWRVSLDDLHEECLADFGNVPMIPPGMVGDAMGTTSLSTDDKEWAVPVKVGTTARLHIIDTESGRCVPIVEAPSIGHPQFHPRDSSLLHYAGAYSNRMWIVHQDGSGHRLAYQRQGREWIVHEIWNPVRRELLAVNWPKGMIGVDIDSGKVRPVCLFKAWHAMIGRNGNMMVCDTNDPDLGLHLFDPQCGRGDPILLCESKATNAGAHWHTDYCPYDDGPVQVYAPQHTHPHPTFSPDGRQVVFTSDRTGQAQIYEVTIP